MNSSPRYLLAVTALAGLLAAACSDDRGADVAADSGGSGNGGSGSQPAATTNQAPRITGSEPADATVGQFWSYQPSVYDADGDSLTVSASNLPGWVSLNSATGRLSGTPAEGDVRVWSGIGLTVSDGRASATLPVFNVTVVDENGGTGSVTLSWLPPTERVDGSPVGPLSGYRLMYGQASREYTEAVIIDNPGITTYMIEGLTAGDWYFAIQTVDAQGYVSGLSAEAFTRI